MDRTGTTLRWGAALAVLVVAGVVVSMALDRTGAEIPDPIEVAVGADAAVPEGELRQLEPERVVALGIGQLSAVSPALVAPPVPETSTGTSGRGSVGDDVVAPVRELLDPVPTVEVPAIPDPAVAGPLLDPDDELPVLGPATTTTTALPPLPSLLDPLRMP